MLTRLKTFLTNDSGAVTVDWVVLTASIVSMSLVILLTIYQATNNASAGLTSDITETTVAAGTGV